MEKRNWNRESLLEISGAYWQSCTLHAAVALDLFTAIGDEWKDVPALAEETGADRRGLALLLNALAAMGLLEKRGESYAGTEASARHLREDSPDHLGQILMHHHHLAESWAHLDAAVRSGRPNRTSYGQEEWRESFLLGMFELAMGLAPAIAARVDLSGRRRLLDLGGGPGTYAAFFCLANPELAATVFDRRESRPFAEKTIERFGLEGRIDFAGGDFLRDPLPGGFDVAWLSHILHGEGPEGCRRIIETAVTALEPGGLILIHEFILNDDLAGPLFPALFGLNMLQGTESGRAYSEAQLTKMLADAGVGEIRRLPVETGGQSGIICGRIEARGAAAPP